MFGGTKEATKPLDDAAVKQLYLGAVFPTSKEVTSIDFHRDGDFCVTASADGLIQFFDCKQGK
jgi:WD40 repeat protein